MRLRTITRIVPAFDRGFRVFRHTLECGHTTDRQAKDNRPRKFTFYGRPRRLRCYECPDVLVRGAEPTRDLESASSASDPKALR